MSNLYENIGQYLYVECIVQNEFSIEELAKAIRVSQDLLRKIIRGKRRLSVDVAKRIECATKMSALVLLSLQSFYELSNLKGRRYSSIPELTHARLEVENLPDLNIS